MLGLVLEGGGTKGSYQIGAYEALLDEGIEVDGVTGTSIGSLNGALIVQGDYKKAKELWENIDYSMIVKASEEEIERFTNFRLGMKDISFLGGKIKDLIKYGGLDISPLREMLDKYIDEDKIRESEKDFGMVTVNVSNMESLEIFIEDIPKGELKNFLLASSYLPIFKSEKMNGSFYLDGAFHDNLPFSMLKSKGYNRFILVRIFGTGLVKKIDMSEEDHIVIEPREDLGTSFGCDPQRSRYNMKLGYYDTLRVLRGLKGNKYYIREELDEDYYFDYFSNLSDLDVQEVSRILNLAKKSKKRLIFEDLLPKLALYLDLGSDYDYEDIFIGLLEAKASRLDIERFHIYDMGELIDLVSESRFEYKESNFGIFGKIKEKVGSISILNREDTILKVSNVLFTKRITDRSE